MKAIEFYDEDYVIKAVDSTKLQKEIQKLEKTKPIIDTPDDLRNLVVFCKTHHRLVYSGVHTISFPIWLALSAVPEKGGILTKEQILIAAAG
ncbi:hypothetical protein HY745_10975 [Candidatus Desantisbacteria bacterium]|nr:hypothetical protein [Candidatus Desantisbacteria bacterium]